MKKPTSLPILIYIELWVMGIICQQLITNWLIWLPFIGFSLADYVLGTIHLPVYLSHGCTEMNQHIWPQQPLLQSRMGMWVPKWSPCVHVCTDRPCLGGNGHYGQAHGIAILLVSYMVGYNNIVELDLSDTCIVKLSQGQGTPGTHFNNTTIGIHHKNHFITDHFLIKLFYRPTA